MKPLLTTTIFKPNLEEVVYQNELNLNNKFKIQIQKLNEKNQNLNIWQWQHYTFEENILGSMKIAKKGMTNLKKNYFDNYNKFQLEII